MAYRNVFYALQEVFPQVDPRILKEVAIKYSSDVDTAVEFVLSDVLPVITENEPTEKYFPLPPDYGLEEKDNNLGHETRQNLYPIIENHDPIYDDVASSSNATSSFSSSSLMKRRYMEKNKQVVGEALSSQFVPNYLYPQENTFNFNSNTPINPMNYDANTNLIQLEDYSDLHYQPLNAQGIENLKGNLMDSVISEVFENGETKLEGEKEPLLPKKNENENEFGLSDVRIISERNEFEHSEVQIIPEENELEKKSQIDSLDELISDMTKNKEILSRELESTIYKMKEVEIEEENAKLAKEAIIEADKKTRSMVENIDHMIKCTKETNYERAGEVESEKFMLENESKELYQKLINLFTQKDEYLSSIHEINNILDARLKVVIEDKERAQKEIAEKEGIYLEIHKEKEIVLEEINKESLRLEKETEDNNMQLRDLLIECGHKVATLQGEISDINKEVISVRKKLNEYIQLNTPIPVIPVQETPIPEVLVQEIPVKETPVPEIPVQETPLEIPVQETPLEILIQETPLPVVPEITVQEIPPLVPCSLASSNFLEDHESTTFDGAKSILQNDYLTIKEHRKIKEKEKELPQKESPKNNGNASSDDDWEEIY